MQNFVFFNPTELIFGKKVISQIGSKIKRDGFNRIMLVVGCSSIKKNGVYNLVVESLKQADIEWCEIWGIRPNPTLSKAYEAIEFAKANNVQAVLAVGGGSVIDSGKVIAAGVFMNDIWDAFESHSTITKALPIYAVLTISASGSEMNPCAVITNEKKMKKWSIIGPALFPRSSIVDPYVQNTLLWQQTLNGTLDAMSHIMEYYFAADQSEVTLEINDALLRTIINMTDQLKIHPKDYNSRSSLVWAITLALNGISGAGLGSGNWVSHSIAHSISAINPNIPHGIIMGVLFPAWIRYYSQDNPAIFQRWANNMWGTRDINAGVTAMKAKIKSWDGPITLGALGIDKLQVDKIIINFIKFGFIYKAKKSKEDDIREILWLAS